MKRTENLLSSTDFIFSPSIRWANPDRILMAALTSEDEASRSFVDFRAFSLEDIFRRKIDFSVSRDRNEINGQADVAVDVYFKFKINVELIVYSEFKLVYAQLGNRKPTPMKTMLFGIVANCITKMGTIRQ